jgi:hypothetical protein
VSASLEYAINSGSNIPAYSTYSSDAADVVNAKKSAKNEAMLIKCPSQKNDTFTLYI